MKSEKNVNDNRRFLSDRSFILFIGFLSAFVPMSTDLYLPALPKMVDTFHTNISVLNLTITFFFIFYAIGMLFWGPLSDKYGRRRILLIGMTLYCIGSLLCANSNCVETLIIFRIIQAIGSGSAVSVSTAMMKDVYTGKKLVAMLAVVQSISMTTPVIAPVIGSFILKYTSWHGIFWTLTIVSVIAIIGGFLLNETLKNYNTDKITKVFGNLKTVSKNPGFSILVLIFSITTLPLMAYITMSSYIYIDGFGLKDDTYSYFYAFTALFLIIGPMLYIKLSKRFKSSTIMTVDFIVVILSGILLITIGNKSPYVFALSLIPAMLCGNMLRPPSTNLMLAQQENNIGSAASLISFSSTIMGSIGMILITLDIGNKIVVIGFMYLFIFIISLVLWLLFHKKHFIKQVD